MKFTLVKIILFINIFVISLFGGELRDKTLDEINNYFKTNKSIAEYKVYLEDNLKVVLEKKSHLKFITKYIYYYEISNSDTIIGYAVLDNVYGKVKPITFLAIFDLDFNIKKVSVIKYREQYGTAVKRDDWLLQFKDKDSNSALQLNLDIDGISGATISAKAITKGVKRSAFLITKIRSNGKNIFKEVR